MNKPVKIGIIGCGDVMTAYMYHAQLLRGQGLVEITWACDTKIEKADLMKQRYNIPQFTTNHQELLASDQVDLVLILTSMKEHSSLAASSLIAGKHVLLEKPMAVTLDDAKNLLKLATKSQGYLLCAPFVQLSPTYHIIGNRIHRGDIGKVLTVRARYGHAGQNWSSWYYQQGGGAIFDLAPYNLTSLTGWLGPARRVIAMTGIAIPERIIASRAMNVTSEDNAHLLVDFGDNVFAVVTSAYTMQQYRSPAIELYGTQGTIQMMGDDWDPEGYELWLNEVGAWQIFKETDPGWLWTDGLSHLVTCILQGIPPLITPEHAYHVTEIMVKGKESGRDGRAYTIESDFPRLCFDKQQEEIKMHLLHDRTHKRE